MRIPISLIPDGVNHSAIVYFKTEPLENSLVLCTTPLPKVCCPINLVFFKSLKAPATISEALAEPLLTKMTNFIFSYLYNYNLHIILYIPS